MLLNRFYFSLFLVSCTTGVASSDELVADAKEVSALTDTATTSTCTSTLWDELNATQKAQVLTGAQVQIDDPDPTYWQTTFYQWIARQSPTSNPLGDAAVFWDLEGQVAYQAPLGLVDFAIDSGRGTAAVRATVTATLQTPAGPVEIPYKQENSVYRVCANTYSVSWHSTDPAHPPVPGIPFVGGDITFQRFPGDGGGALMKYRINAAPIAALVGNADLRAGLIAQIGAVANAHVVRMRQGASASQILQLLLSLN